MVQDEEEIMGTIVSDVGFLWATEKVIANRQKEGTE